MILPASAGVPKKLQQAIAESRRINAFPDLFAYYFFEYQP
jgi:hypothetical protein